jgi:UPF0716 protein FxsA
VLARLLLLFTVVPLVELYLLVRIGELVGAWPTIALVLVTGIVGAWLTRLEGLRVLRTVQLELSQGRLPTASLMDGLLILVAGVLLVTPGLITDLCGFALLVPPLRRTVRRTLRRAWERRLGTEQERVIDAEWRRGDDG